MRPDSALGLRGAGRANPANRRRSLAEGRAAGGRGAERSAYGVARAARARGGRLVGLGLPLPRTPMPGSHPSPQVPDRKSRRNHARSHRTLRSTSRRRGSVRVHRNAFARPSRREHQCNEHLQGKGAFRRAGGHIDSLERAEIIDFRPSVGLLNVLSNVLFEVLFQTLRQECLRKSAGTSGRP